MSPIPGSPVGSLWKEIPITRAFFYINFRVPSNGNPPSPSIISAFSVSGLSMILNRAPVQKGAHLQSLLKYPVNEHPAKFPSRAPTMSDFCF